MSKSTCWFLSELEGLSSWRGEPVEPYVNKIVIKCPERGATVRRRICRVVGLGKTYKSSVRALKPIVGKSEFFIS